MRVFITGGTGFVGTRLIPHLLESGHRVHLLLREGEQGKPLPPGVTHTVGDPMEPGPWWDPLRDCDAAINLAGHPIFTRWTAHVKVLIRDSRTATTRNLVAAIPRDRPFTLLSASGIGIYGDCKDRELDEDEPLGRDFLAGVARDWEAEARRAEAVGARVALLRFGIIFDADGGALPELVHNVRTLRAGQLGSGRQWMAWIHREDVVRGCGFLLEQETLRGPINFSAPEPARQLDVARTLGHLLGRHKLVRVPLIALRLALGEGYEIAGFSQRGQPRRLLEAGFRFRHPDLESALREILPRMP